MADTRKVVAIQLAVRLAAIDDNLRHIEDIVGQAAREHSPDMIFMPEVSTTPNVCHRAMRSCHGPVDGAPLALYRRLAREHGCIVGGGALVVRGTDARNTYFICEPDGTTHLHDKDQPTMWENNYYGKGEDPGAIELSSGDVIGCANGFEWARTRTAARLRGRVKLLAGGMCFPSYPKWALTRPYLWKREHTTMLQLARETPTRIARAIGCPAVHPSHVGDIVFETPMAAPIPWPTIMVGETIITDELGNILERLAYEDGEGYICAEVNWREPEPLDPLPETFWMTSLPLSTHLVWHLCNAHGRGKYLAMKALGRHAWQHEPYHGDDLPNRIAAPAADSAHLG
ncbi:MAG: carbon-nitrogen hydrolase family protein [Thermoleophilaceae bacterium]|nr:carbon-nitrogen hydrolase family protein [Thermoleophilaceae bacterium]